MHEDADGLHAEFVGDGDDLGLLIGHHGQTIDAIQHLAYRIASHGEGDRVSVLVDAAGYRERRAMTLRATADQAVQQALSGRRPVSLDAMSALERKVIHEHLKDRHDVETYSEGQEPSRLSRRRSAGGLKPALRRVGRFTFFLTVKHVGRVELRGWRNSRTSIAAS